MTDMVGGAQLAGPKFTTLIGLAGVSATLVGIAFFLLWSGTGQWHLGLDSEQWPVTQGKVASSEVVVVGGHGRVAPREEAQVSYAYVVAGTSYTSDRFSFGEAKPKLKMGMGREDARTIVSAYPVGATVTVHYRAGTPGMAVLEPGVSGGAVLRTLAGVLAAIAVFLVPVVRGRGSSRRSSSLAVAASGGSGTHASPKGGMTGPARLTYLLAMASIAWSGFESDPSGDLPTLAAALIVVGVLTAIYLNTAFRCGACGTPFAMTAMLGGWRLPPPECPNCGARL